MSIVEIKSRLVQNVVCEIELLKMGKIDCADSMLTERIAAMDRLWALECLMDTGDSTYDEVVSYLYEQLKELAAKLTINI